MTAHATACPTGNLARFAAGLTAESIPPGVLARARSCLVDTIGAGLGGSQLPSLKGLAPELARSSPGAIHLWGSRATAAPQVAALFNAAASHAEDFDDTHTAAVVHGSAAIVPAVVAVAEQNDLPMIEMLRGVVGGWEVAARIGEASHGGFHRRGMHTSSVAGVLGAATAVAVTRNLTAETILNAWGLAGSAASGLNAYLQNGSLGKLVNLGFAAQAGFQAAQLAMAGITGPHDVIEGPAGVLDSLCDAPGVLDGGDLGQRWAISAVSTKPMPCCHFAHASIAAAIALRSEIDDPSEITEIECGLPPATFPLLKEPWPTKIDPPTMHSVRFSGPWLLALALIDGSINRATFSPRLLERDDVRELAHRVSIVPWDDSPYPKTFPGRVGIRLHNGRELQAERLVNPGHPDAPADVSAARDKFIDCSVDVIADPEGAFDRLTQASLDAPMTALITESTTRLDSSPSRSSIGDPEQGLSP